MGKDGGGTLGHVDWVVGAVGVFGGLDVEGASVCCCFLEHAAQPRHSAKHRHRSGRQLRRRRCAAHAEVDKSRQEHRELNQHDQKKRDHTSQQYGWFFLFQRQGRSNAEHQGEHPGAQDSDDEGRNVADAAAGPGGKRDGGD